MVDSPEKVSDSPTSLDLQTPLGLELELELEKGLTRPPTEARNSCYALLYLMPSLCFATYCRAQSQCRDTRCSALLSAELMPNLNVFREPPYSRT